MSLFSEENWVGWVDEISDNGFVVIDEFLPEEQFNVLRNYFLHHLENNEFHKAGIGDSTSMIVREEVRGDHILWLERSRDQVTDGFLNLADEAVAMFNRLCYLSLSDHEFHFAVYPPGSFYKKHLDQFRERNNRLISMIIYLNVGWKKGDGGELRVFIENDTLDIEPVGNRCVMFRSDILPHEVLPTRVSRYSLTGWLLYHPAELGGLLAHL